MVVNRYFPFFCIAFVLLGITRITAQDKLRAPANPLITHSPNFSIWSMASKLNNFPTQNRTNHERSLFGISKVDDSYYRFLCVAPKTYKTILPTSDETGYEVDYTEQEPNPGWEKLKFTSIIWKKGRTPFSDNINGANTIWKSTDLWYSRTFDLNVSNLKNLYLKLRHDDKAWAIFMVIKSVVGKVGDIVLNTSYLIGVLSGN